MSLSKARTMILLLSVSVFLFILAVPGFADDTTLLATNSDFAAGDYGVNTLAASSVGTGGYNRVSGSEATFYKILLMDKDAYVPDVTFEFVIMPGEGVVFQNNISAPILAPTPEEGVYGLPTITSVSFKTTDPTGDVDGNIPIAEDMRAMIGTITADFTSVSFSEPGTYRYVVKEIDTDSKVFDCDIASDHAGADHSKYLDVYVLEDQGQLKIGQYALHEIDPSESDWTAESDRKVEKTIGFVNSYNTYELTLGEKVAGNQGSKDKYFRYRLTFKNMIPNSALKVDWENALRALNPLKTEVTVYSKETMAEANNSDDIGNSHPFEGFQWKADNNGEIQKEVYLKHGQTLRIAGIQQSSSYVIAQDPEDYSYKATVDVQDDQVSISKGDKTITNGYVTQDDNYVVTNTKNGIVPTGVFESVCPGLFMISIALAFIAAVNLNARKKKEDPAPVGNGPHP